MQPRVRSLVRRAGTLALTLIAAAASGPRPDLDVGIPPGPPVDWSRSFPAITPGDGPLFPTTPSGAPADPGRTRSEPARDELDVRLSSTFGMVRVLTWDIELHLTWLPGALDLERITGSDPALALPAPGPSMYWISLAPLLRLMLHPRAVSRTGTVAHLVEIGEPVLGVLEAARSEKNLRDVTSEVAERVDYEREHAPPAPEGATPRATMLKRWMQRELLSVHPYDPEAAFGRRLFLFGDELLPHVVGFASVPDPFLRRNAVAALGRYPTAAAQRALLSVAAGTPDDVCLARACAALGTTPAQLDAAPLLARLAENEDRFELVVLVGALGRMQARDAVPRLLELGIEALKDEPDVLQAVLIALATIPRPEQAAQVVAFAQLVEDRAEQNPRGWQPRTGKPSQEPDSFDPDELTAQILTQLARLVRARLDPTDRSLGSWIASLIPLEAPNVPVLARQYATSRTLAQVHPPARYLFLDTLARFGERGQAVLAVVAADNTCEPELRAYALARLGYDERAELALAILEDETSDVEMRIVAFDRLASDRHAKLEEHGRALLEECAEMEPGGGSPPLRHLYLAAVRVLGERELLGPADLQPLLVHPGAPRHAHGELPARVRAMATDLVALAAGGEQKNRLRDAVDALLDILIAARANPAVSEDSREGRRGYVLGQLRGVKSHRGDPNYLRTVADAIASELLGFPVDSPDYRQGGFRPAVLLEEEILLALGRTGGPPAVALLGDFLAQGGGTYAGVACLALGLTGEESAARPLVRALLSDDPFARFCAYESLRHVTRRDHFADWIEGPLGERSAAAEKYFQWVNEER